MTLRMLQCKKQKFRVDRVVRAVGYDDGWLARAPEEALELFEGIAVGFILAHTHSGREVHMLFLLITILGCTSRRKVARWL